MQMQVIPSKALDSILYRQRERPIQPGTPEFDEPEMDTGISWEVIENSEEQQEQSQVPEWIMGMIKSERELSELVQTKRKNWYRKHRLAWETLHIKDLRGKSYMKIMREYYAFCQEHKVKVPKFKEEYQLEHLRRSLEGIIPEWEGRVW